MIHESVYELRAQLKNVVGVAKGKVELLDADRLRSDGALLLRLPELIRRIEERFPPRGGAPVQPPLPPVPLLWQRGRRGRGASGSWCGYLAAALIGGGLMWGAMLAGWMP